MTDLEIINASLRDVMKAQENLTTCYLKFYDSEVSNSTIEINISPEECHYLMLVDGDIQIETNSFDKFQKQFEEFFEI